VPESAAKFNAAEDLSFLIKKGNVISLVHKYKNKDNQLLGFTVRVEDNKTGKKQVLPVAYGHSEILDKSCWHLKGFSDAGTKPIYGLEKLAQNPNKPIVIVEGEKTADAASELLPDHNVISWMGGAQAVDKVDWSKMSNRVVSIWPDNDKPGIDAAKNITNHIDCHNGFSGLVSIVDTEKLVLPKKWDLADDVPKNSKLSDISFNEAIDNDRINNTTFSHKLEISYDNTKNIDNKTQESLVDSITMLASRGKISEDKYSSKLVYRDSIVAIAKSKSIDLDKIQDHKEFISTINDIQHEYRSLHAEYSANIAIVNDNSHIHENTDSKEKLANDFIRDISVCHQLQLGINKITKTHTDHISETVSAEINKMQRFTDGDKEHAANNIYKAINEAVWRDKLDATNLEKTSNISLRFTAKSIDEFLVGTGSASNTESNGHLANIRQYAIDENSLLKTFKEGHINGADELKNMSEKLTIASGFVAEHSLVIDEAKKWGYEASNIDITRSLSGMNKNESYDYINDIRNSCLESYFASNFREFAPKRFALDFEKQKVVISKEQSFLKGAFEKAATSEDFMEYNRENRYLLMSGQSISNNPEKLDELFEKCENIKSLDIRTDRELCGDMAYSRNIVSLIKKASTTIERHNIRTIPAELAAIREKSSSIDVAFDSIEKEQHQLADQHGKIKYLDFETKLLAKCEVAHHQREDNSFGDLKEIANKALDQGVKTEIDLLKDLQQVTDLKASHISLDKDIEVHHINKTLDSFEQKKQEAKTPNEILVVISKEQDFLSNLHNNIKYPEQDSSIVEKCKLANSQKEDNSFRDLKNITNQALEAGVKTEIELIKDLQNTSNLKEGIIGIGSDIENYQIKEAMVIFEVEKNNAETPITAMNAIAKKESYLSNIENKLKYPENIGEEITNAIEIANENKEFNTLKDLNNLVVFISDDKLYNNTEILESLKEPKNLDKLVQNITTNYQTKYIQNVEQDLNQIDKQGDVFVDKQKFDNHIEYLDYTIKKCSNKYSPDEQLDALKQNAISKDIECQKITEGEQEQEQSVNSRDFER